ncbi:MAG TPA: alpha/beta hydrolase [Gammaproteobacteria bacterium]|nr:alpha/beta hydrolase [Gammaproteobacteria bacterium]HIK70181.1 alpha/beta hydrolase [Pseudomonadales bacterium]
MISTTTDGVKLSHHALRSGILALLLFLSYSSVFTVDNAKASSSEAAAALFQDKWWRSIRKDMWQWEGADWAVISTALERIENASGVRRYGDKVDTIVKYGPGNWIYEWNQIAETAYKQGLEFEQEGDQAAARKYFLEAAIYYTQASYPHFRDSHSKAALSRAFEMYRRAGRYFEMPLEEWKLEVDGVGFSAFIHLPQVSSSDSLAVIMKTGGMDVLSTEYYPLSETINHAGAVMIAYDSPGTGNDGIVDREYDKHHVAVLKRILKDPRFDSDRIGVWSESLAGLTAVKLAIGDYRESVAAAVNSCGPMHALYAMEITGGVPEGYDVHKLVDSYRSGDLSPDQISKFNQAMLNPALKAMLIDFQGETFTDRVRSNPENVLDLLSKSLPISLVEQGRLSKKNITNTPILTINTHSDPLVPQVESQMATDVSVQGRLMIYSDYGGHCVSRSEIPVIMEWLAYHLKLDSLGNLVESNREE